jgi:ring-1,2-phenylacetyl-CoA epoxidase subunit PaaD
MAGSGSMTSSAALTDSIRCSVSAVEDPELPVTIADLGMIRDIEVEALPEGLRVLVRLRPTFLGCPARFLIEASVRDRVAAFDSVTGVNVTWDSAATWRPEDISDAGRAKLTEHGVIVDVPGAEHSCPYCGEPGVQLVSERGVALCRRLAYCPACQSSVDVIGAARGPGTAAIIAPSTLWAAVGRREESREEETQACLSRH